MGNLIFAGMDASFFLLPACPSPSAASLPPCRQPAADLQKPGGRRQGIFKNFLTLPILVGPF